jgi:ribosomal protein L31
MQAQATKLLLSITDTVSTSDLRMEVSGAFHPFDRF